MPSVQPNAPACRLGKRKGYEVCNYGFSFVLRTSVPKTCRHLKSGMVTDSVKSDTHWQNLFGTKMATKSDEPCIGLLVRQFSFVFFGMFELTSVSFGIALNLVAKGMAKLP